jgi:phosphoglycolate phosphatase-like HAD superfamily hydrolase
LDGTLIDTKGAGVPALLKAVEKISGKTPDFSRSSVAGLTDHQIMTHLFEVLEFPITSEQLKVALNLYTENLQIVLENQKVEVLGNGLQVLEDLAKLNFINIICTGNIALGAEIKLKSAGLLEQFELNNIFTSEEMGPRSAILREALAKSHASSKEVVVIGDTEHDIYAAREVGLKVIAVEGVKYSSKELSQFNPDGILEQGWNTSDIVQILDLI